MSLKNLFSLSTDELSSSMAMLREKPLFHEAKKALFKPQNTPKFKTNSIKYVITSWGTKALNQFQENTRESRILKFLGSKHSKPNTQLNHPIRIKASIGSLNMSDS